MKPSKSAYKGEIFRIEFWRVAWISVTQNAAEVCCPFCDVGNVGKISNEQKFKHLTGTDQLFEFKADQGRVLCFFFVGKRVILTHGFSKKSDKTPKGEIDRAEKTKAEFSHRKWSFLWSTKNMCRTNGVTHMRLERFEAKESRLTYLTAVAPGDDGTAI